MEHTHNSKPSFWQRLIAPHPSLQDPGAQYRASLLAGMGLVLSFLSLIGLFSGYLMHVEEGLTRPATVTTASLAASFLAVYMLARTRHYRIGAVFLAGMLILAAVFLAGNSQDMPNTHLYYTLPLLFIFGIAMFNPRGMWILFLAIILALIAIILLRSLSAPLEVQNIGASVGATIASSILAVVVVYFNKAVENARLAELKSANRELTLMRHELEQRVAERTQDITQRTLELEKYTSQLEIIASVARSVTTIQELNQLLPSICRAVSDKFGFYHTGIFLIDERGEYAVLQAANSQGGERMLRRGHRLRVGTTGIVGMVAGQGKARIALDVGADAVYFNNPDLPDTRSEMALPLNIGGQTAGVIDVQSTETNAFRDEDVAVLGILADQVAVAIENARLFGQTKQALEDSQSIYQQYVKQDWAQFTHTLKHRGYTYDGIKFSPLDGAPPSLPPHALSIPIKVRGLPVGTVSVKSNNPLRAWSQEEINLAQAAADRAGLAIENFRLLTEAQRRAAKERAVGEITARIGSSVDVHEIMQTAVEELGRAMPGSEVIVQLKSREQ